jgi:hypothetical protein
MTPGRRILVSMSHAVSARGVETALASVWIREPVEITGLFIEDPDVINLGRLRVSREVRFADARAQVPETAGMEREMRAQADRVQRAFESVARRMNISTSFRIARGRLPACLSEVWAGVDVLVVAAARDWLGQRLLLRPNLAELLASGPPVVMLVNQAAGTGGGVAVLAENTVQGRMALETAVEIARAQQLPLSVLLPAGDDEVRVGLRTATLELASDYTNVAFYRIGKAVDAREIAGIAQRAATRLLVLPRNGENARRQTALDVLEQADCSVLLAG